MTPPFTPIATIRARNPTFSPPPLHNTAVHIHRETEHSLIVETKPGKKFLISRKHYTIDRDHTAPNRVH